MIIIGVSGLIAAGKSTFSNSLSQFRIPVFDADKAVHNAFMSNSVIDKLKKRIPQVVEGGKVDRRKLSDIAFSDKKVLSFLESHLHPIVRSEMRKFIKYNFDIGTKVVILDIPLLFESNIYNICDYTILVKCSFCAQKYRYLRRGNSSSEKLRKILDIQKKNIFKEKKADFIFDTTLSKVRNFVMIKDIINKVISDERNSSRYRDYRFKSRRWRSSN